MCGRFTISVNKESIQNYLQSYFEINFEDQFSPRYNIAPNQKVLAIIHDGNRYRAGYIKWGFIPQSKPKYQIINVRAETIEQKPFFKDSFLRRRCLIIADSFYEWKKGSKEPVRFYLHHLPFAFAGIYNVRILENGEKEATCAIITTNANNIVRKVHYRMPVIIEKDKYAQWLKPHQDLKVLKSLLVPYEKEMDGYIVSQMVNNPQNDNPECLEKIKDL